MASGKPKQPTMMDAYKIAQGFVGTKEIKGAEHNPIIVGFAKSIGHGWVQDDETPWCAAFVGAVLRTAGFKSTRSLAARSYEKWGVGVTIDKAQRGDVVVLSRGNPSSGKGHVGFLSHFDDTMDCVFLLGGNQGDQVQVSKYDAGRIVAIRRGKGTNPPAKDPVNLAGVGAGGVALSAAAVEITDVGEAVSLLEQQLPLVERIFQMENLPAFLLVAAVGLAAYLVLRNFKRENRGE